jgi:hypothetical protein
MVRKLKPAVNGHEAGDRLADDLLPGAQAIAEELGESLRRTRYMLERGYLPGRKVGGIWYGSRARLREFFTGEAAEG